VVALELSNGSNGWFRFILDGKLATMYSSGSPEGGSDSSGMSCSDSCDLRVILLAVFVYECYNDSLRVYRWFARMVINDHI